MIHRVKPVWKGYCPAECWQEQPYAAWWPCVLEVTERLWEKMEGITLRGTVWVIERVPGEGKRTEVTGAMIDRCDTAKLRTDVDIKPVVYRVYRTMQIEFGVKPVMPPRQMLLPSSDAPPPTAAPPVDPRNIEGTPEWKADRAAAHAALQRALKNRGVSVPTGNGKGGAQ
jgi:hypothetical protein